MAKFAIISRIQDPVQQEPDAGGQGDVTFPMRECPDQLRLSVQLEPDYEHRDSHHLADLVEHETLTLNL